MVSQRSQSPMFFIVNSRPVATPEKPPSARVRNDGFADELVGNANAKQKQNVHGTLQAVIALRLAADGDGCFLAPLFGSTHPW